MILILGGAYQGKLDFAKTAFHLLPHDIFTCHNAEIDFSKRCIDHLEEFTLACIRNGVDPIAYLQSHREDWRESIFLCEDIFCGVVPMDAQLREWRQSTGRLCQYLSHEAAQVSRIFCGLEQRLK